MKTVMMKTKKILTFCTLLFGSLVAFAQEGGPLWMRYPAISPDGREIAFAYQGDLYKVKSTGGLAQRLTTDEAYDTQPVWSPDGSRIAFVSTRYHGARDIYIMSANGGAARRVTTHSTSEVPLFFSNDGKYLYYAAQIQDDAESALHPTRMGEVYRVPVEGGRTTLVMGTPLSAATLAPDGKYMLYEDQKGMENYWRKHQKNSVARDIVRYDFDSGKYTPVVNSDSEDRNPVLSADGKTLYFLSERNGSFNLFATDARPGAEARQLTNFKGHPVRFLSIAKDNTLAFGYDGEIYTLTAGAQPKKVKVQIHNDLGPKLTENLRLRGGITSADVSADGKQIAFVVRGEVFVTSSDYKTTKRITDTAAEESSVTFGSDGRSLVYASQRNGKSDLYVARIVRDEEKAFPYATLIKEEKLIPGDKSEKMGPLFSPDGKEIAFVKDRNKVAVYNVANKRVRLIVDSDVISYRDGDLSFTWSPDSKWLALNMTTNHHEPYADVVLASVTESKPTLHNLTNSGYFATNPRFVMGGDAIIYSSEQYGMRNHASWGSMNDVMIVFLNREAFNKFQLSKEEYELLSEAEKEAKKKEEAEDKEEKKDEQKEILVELDNIERRILRLTPASSNLGDAYITEDGKKLYYMAAFEDGYDLWVKDLREGSTTLLNKMNGSYFQMAPDREEKDLFLISGNELKKMNLSSEKISPIAFEAEMRLDQDLERAFMYDYVCREEGERFYEESMHGVDWQGLTKHYKKFVPYITNNHDFAEMLSELLGELNVSHTGSGYSAPNSAPRTAELGLFLDFTPDPKGVRVEEVVVGGPFDVYSSKVKAGDYITAIDGQKIAPDTDLFPLLEGKVGKATLVSFTSPSGQSWDEVIKPISRSKLNGLLYDRWVAQREAEVDRLSNGRLGYVHIPTMDDASYRTVYAKALGKFYQRDGIVIDVRYNGGGRLHEDIEVLFSGKKYLTQEIRGRYYCDMPSRRWTKPSVMVTCEMDYSNAHGTPWVYQYMGIGKVVGMPVPGTMTSVNWVTLQDPSLYFGIPAVGYRTAEGYFLENHQLEPDVKAPLDFTKALKGVDTQLETAVEVLLKELK